MHHALVFNQADAYATVQCTSHLHRQTGALLIHLAADRKVQSVQQAALSFDLCPLHAVHHADLEIIHKARYIVESSSCVKQLGPCEVLSRLDLILENYEYTLQTTSLAVQIQL